MTSSDDLKWAMFVKIGQTIYTKRGDVRIVLAKQALGFAKDLEKSGYSRSTDERISLFDELLNKIAEYLDADTDTIKSAVVEHFLFQHALAGHDKNQFHVSYEPKRSGIQSGFICDVFNGPVSTRYFIKTHQNGPTPQNIKSQRTPDAMELFVYKLLELIGVGPEVYFIIPIHGTRRTVYIATKDAKLTLLSSLNPKTANLTALLKMDLICRILCLSDCCTNTGNCGQVEDKPMIVDFRVEMRAVGYMNPDILEEFIEGTTRYYYAGLMRTAVDLSEEIKLDVARESLKGWDLLNVIDEAQIEISKLIALHQGTIHFTDTLSQYISDVKSTINVLQGQI